MGAVAFLVTNVGLVQLAGVQPAHAVTTFLVLNEGFDGLTPPTLPAGWTALAPQAWGVIRHGRPRHRVSSATPTLQVSGRMGRSRT